MIAKVAVRSIATILEATNSALIAVAVIVVVPPSRVLSTVLAIVGVAVATAGPR